jgi:hypothetical protein
VEAFALLISLVALAVAGLAFYRTGGLADLRREVEKLRPEAEAAREKAAETIRRELEELRPKAQRAREKAADVLDRLERVVRGEPGGPAAGGSAERGP